MATPRVYERGTYLFLEGDAPTHVIVILEGMVKLTRSVADGRSVVIELRAEGDIIGELGPVDHRPRSTAAAAVSAVEALTVPAETFRHLVHQRPGLAWELLAMLAERLRQSTQRQLEAGTSDAVTRLAGRLVELAAWGHRVGEDGSLALASSLTQQELAEWVGVSRDAVVLAFRQLRKLRLVETGRQQIRILDLAALEAFAHRHD